MKTKFTEVDGATELIAILEKVGRKAYGYTEHLNEAPNIEELKEHLSAIMEQGEGLAAASRVLLRKLTEK